MGILRRTLTAVPLAALALLGCGGAVAAHGAVIYVAASGNDGANGSASAPLRSLPRAVEVVRPGDRVIVEPGSYAGFRMTAAGRPDAPIRITGVEGGPLPRIRPSGSSNSVVLLDGVHDVRLSHLDISRNPIKWGAGVRVRGGSSRVELSDLHVHDNRSFGVLLEDVTDTVVSSSLVYANETGLQVSRAGAGVRIVGNDVHDNNRLIVNDARPGNDRGANGMVFYRATGPVTVERNRVWGNRGVSHDYGFDGGAFEVYAASGLKIRDNVVWNNQNVMETGTDGTQPCAGNRFSGNVAYGGRRHAPAMGLILRCARNMVVARNTFDDLDGFVFDITAAASSFGGSIQGLRIMRNVAVSRVDKLLSVDSALPSSVSVDHDVLFNRSGGYLGYFAGRGNTRSLSALTSWSGLEAGGIHADPMFIDPAAGDFRLRHRIRATRLGAGGALDLARLGRTAGRAVRSR